jgi:RND superfamily putative drug exporter
MALMAGRLTAFVVRFRWAVAGFWVAATLSTTLLLPSLDEAQTGALGDLVPADSKALEAERHMQDRFGFPLFSRTAVIARDAKGLTRSTQARLLGDLAALDANHGPPFEDILGALPLANGVGAITAPEAGTAVLGYLFIDPSVGQSDRTELARSLARQLQADAPEADVGVTGLVPARAERGRIIKDKLPLTELVTLALVAILVAAFFRAPAVALLGLVAVGVAYLVSAHVMSSIGSALGFSVPHEIEPVIVALLFGIITDYHVFLVSRYRSRLQSGEGQREAATAATQEIVPVVATAAAIIVGASLSLLVADIGFVRAFGPGMAVAVVVAAAVSLTFIPAVLAITGRALLWPGLGPRPTGEERLSRRGSRSVRLAVRHPGWVAGICTAALLGCAAGVPAMKLGYPLLRGLPASSPVKHSYRELVNGFGPGAVGPTVILIEGRNVATDRPALARLQHGVQRLTGVQTVIGPANLPATANDFVFSAGTDSVRMFALFDADPLSSAALADLDRVQYAMRGIAVAAGLRDVHTSFAGDTAITSETINRTATALVRVAPLALLVVIALLFGLLRTISAPLYVAVANLLTVLAALGLTAIVFEDLLGSRDLAFYVPFAASVLLLSLGADYSVFILSRIWGRIRDGAPARQAVSEAGGEAAATITLAGLVIAGSFAALALIPIDSFRQLAFTMTAGLLLDAFLVRSLLLPAIIVLVEGRRAR